MKYQTLEAVTRIITHESCADGIASALILHDALPSAEIVFLQYNDLAHRELKAEPGLLFCDMTPPRERVQEFVTAGALVLDHHESHRDIVAAFGEAGVYTSEPGVSGAMLAFEHVWLQLVARGGPRSPERQGRQAIMDELAILAGIRDTWQRLHDRWHEACAQGEALKFWPWRRWFYADPRTWASMLQIGSVLVARTAEQVERALERAHRFVSATGLRVVCFEGVGLTSDAAEAVGKECDLLVGWGYHVDPKTGWKVILSCRTKQEDIDIGEFAKLFPGGGGHRKAAGFQLNVLPYDPNPYRVVESVAALLKRTP